MNATASLAAVAAPTDGPGRVGTHPAAEEAASTEGPAVAVEGLRVRRGGRTVLENLSLAVKAGTITAIVGPSGAGKTTLLATLNGLLTPDLGRLRIAGVGLLDSAEKLRRHRQRTSTIFQEHALIDRLPALDNVLLGLADSRHPLSPFTWSRDQRQRAAQALQSLGLLHLAGHRAGSLSGGERQRVGIARALVRGPRLLLGDEPFSALDPALARRLGDEFRALARASGITVILVLHQIDIARSLADRVVGLSRDGIVFDGPAADFDETAQDRLFAAGPALSTSAGAFPFPN